MGLVAPNCSEEELRDAVDYITRGMREAFTLSPADLQQSYATPGLLMRYVELKRLHAVIDTLLMTNEAQRRYSLRFDEYRS